MDAILSVTGLTKRFAGLTAVANVNFELGRGEILGLIGPNGAGKTTLVNLISGAFEPSEGELIFEGKSIGGLAPFRRAHLGIGRTFQIMRPFPGLSVQDNVAVGALFGTGGGERDLAKARAIAQDKLAFVGLARVADRPADALGGPDRKRLELAKALAMNPRLLLLDEVMAGLNHAEIEAVIAIIRKVRDEGVSVIVIEHVMKAIRSLSDRLVVLHHGEMIAEGAPEHVLDDPAVVEAYLGKRRA